MDSKKYTSTLVLLIFVVFALLYAIYPFLDTNLEGFLIEEETAYIDRVIDGDTIVSNKTSIRLLGINSPERGEPYYIEAKEYLEELVLNKTVRLKFGKEREDRYGRTLAYVYINRENVNSELVEKGFANLYFPSGEDKHYNTFKKAWEECVYINRNLCESSKDVCADCIELKEFDYEKEIVVFYNKCDFDCKLTNWEIKDEGRKKFIFDEFILKSNKECKVITGEEKDEDNENILFWKNQKYVWTDTGDTLFLRDTDGKLVLWENY